MLILCRLDQKNATMFKNVSLLKKVLKVNYSAGVRSSLHIIHWVTGRRIGKIIIINIITILILLINKSKEDFASCN